MTLSLQQQLTLLLSPPEEERVDHLTILYALYDDYHMDYPPLLPLLKFYLEGLDDLPSLAEKTHWNLDQFDRARKPFLERFEELKRLVEEALDVL